MPHFCHIFLIRSWVGVPDCLLSKKIEKSFAVFPGSSGLKRIRMAS